MHTLTLIPGLAVFLSMTVTAQVCGNNIFPVGYQCGPNMKNGDRSCDPSCSNIVSHTLQAPGIMIILLTTLKARLQ